MKYSLLIPIPCPIPRCALEWYLALKAIVAGSAVWWSGDPRLGHYDICLPFIHVPMDSMRWGITLWLVALGQIIALQLVSSIPQRWTAGIAAFTWATFATSAYHGGMVAFAGPIAILAFFGQLYICAMLIGAKWRT